MVRPKGRVARPVNTFKAHSDKRQLEALLNRNGFSGLSELGEAPRSRPHPLIHGVGLPENNAA